MADRAYKPTYKVVIRGECEAADFPEGALYVSNVELPIQITHKQLVGEGVILYTAKPRRNGKSYLWFQRNSIVQYDYYPNKKTIKLKGNHALYTDDLLPSP